MESVKNIKKQYKIRNNVLYMLKERKYNVPEDMFNIDFNVFKLKYKNEDLDFILEKNEEKIYVKFYNKSLTSNTFKSIYKQIKNIDENFKILILINQKLSHPIIKLLKTDEFKDVEVFYSIRFIINITKHELAAKHILLSDDEINNLLTKYNCKKNQLKKIKISDPMSEYYAAKLGDVFKIIRKSNSSGLYTDYRVVVE